MDTRSRCCCFLLSPRTARVAILAVPTALLLSACSETTAPGPNDPTESVDVSSVVSNASLLSVERMAAGVSGGVADSAPASGLAKCVYSAASQRFLCPTTTSNGLTITTSYILLDAAGNPQTGADATKIDAFRTIRDVSGVMPPLAAGIGAITLMEHEDQTISGLLAGQLVLNGTVTSTMSDTLTASGLVIPMASQRTQTIANVTLPSSTAGQGWPTGGTITTVTTDLSSDLGSGFSTQTTLTFDPSGGVTMVRTIGTLTSTCHFSFASSGIAPSAVPDVAAPTPASGSVSRASLIAHLSTVSTL